MTTAPDPAELVPDPTAVLHGITDQVVAHLRQLAPLIAAGEETDRQLHAVDGLVADAYEGDEEDEVYFDRFDAGPRGRFWKALNALEHLGERYTWCCGTEEDLAAVLAAEQG